MMSRLALRMSKQTTDFHNTHGWIYG